MVFAPGVYPEFTNIHLCYQLCRIMHLFQKPNFFFSGNLLFDQSRLFLIVTWIYNFSFGDNRMYLRPSICPLKKAPIRTG